ncbi:MAG: putative phage-related protein [Gemmatimonadetes bacterium]|nr:putative phage-related protein [Gemmatimonadota bacterium]
MPPSVPAGPPQRTTAGDTWQWDFAAAEFPSATWTLSWVLSGPARVAIDAGCVVASGGGWRTTIPATTTASISPGTYKLFGFVRSGGERREVLRQPVTVAPDPETAAAATSHAQRTLAIIEARLEGRLAADLESYQIEGRAVTKIPIKELHSLRSKYKDEVRRERAPGAVFVPIRVTFGPPT